MITGLHEWIDDQIGSDNVNNMVDYNERVDAFRDFIEIDSSLRTIIAKMIDGSAQIDEIDNRFLDPEGILKRIHNAAFPKGTENYIDFKNNNPRPNSLFDNDNRNWDMAHYYNDILHLTSDDLSRVENRHFKEVKKARNSHAHGEKYTTFDRNRIIPEMLLVYLQVSGKFSKELRQSVEAQEVKEIDINEIRKEFEKGLIKDYIDLKWENGGKEYNAENVIKICIKNDFHRVKIFDKAGKGKTTALYKMGVVLCDMCSRKEVNIYPVYIELKTLSNTEDAIFNEARRFLGLDLNNTKKQFANGKIWLLLDGYNEILNEEIKKYIWDEIKDMDADIKQSRSLNKPASYMFVTDREKIGAKKVLDDADSFSLAKIKPEDQKEFFEKNIPNKDLYDRVICDMEKNARNYENKLDSPLKLKQFCELAMEEGEVPNMKNQAEQYLKYLLRREDEEKGDNLRNFMEAGFSNLAYQFETGMEINSLLAQRTVKEGIETIAGSNFPAELPSRCIEVGVAMGILAVNTTDNTYYFSTDEYQDIFREWYNCSFGSDA